MAMMRLTLPVLRAFLICYCGVAQSQPTANVDASTSTSAAPASILTRIGILGSKEFTEYRYVVELAKQEARSEATRETPANQSSEWQELRAREKRHDEQAYKRIAERLRHEQNGSSRNPDLAHALYWIERRSEAGYSKADSLVASPDGAYAVHARHDEPLLLIDVSTLETRRLADPSGEPGLSTPVAWAPGSRSFAFATPRTGKLHVYDVERQAVTSTKSGDWQWLEAISWSPDGQQIAAFGTHNRRMNKTPLGLLAAMAGHPEFRNDGVLHVYAMASDRHFSVELKRAMSEWGSAQIRIEWK